jgi:SAM-dependent methyltransferase
MQNIAHGLTFQPRPVDTAQTLDGATSAFYRANAGDYFDRTFHVKMDHLYAPFLAAIGGRGRILDVGCGSGRDVKAFRAKGYDAFGVDSSPELVELARENVGPYFQVARVESLKVDEPFDGVWACASLLHLVRSKINTVLRSLKATLKLGGVLFVTVQRGAGDCVQPDGRYYTYYGTQEFRNAVEEVGLRVLSDWESADSLRSVGGPTWINVLAQRVQQ